MLYVFPRPLIRLFTSGILLAATGLLQSGCGNGPGIKAEAQAVLQLPTLLLMETELTGRILGQTISEPIGVSIDRRGVVFLVDSGNDRVIWFDPTFKALRAVGGQGGEWRQFDEPQFVTVDEDLNIWISDTGNRRLVQYSERFEFLFEIDLRGEDDLLRFGRPSGLAVSKFGEIWVADIDQGQIAVLDIFGQIDHMVGDFGHGGGQLREPAKLISDARGDIYVCDTGNRRVMVYDENGDFLREIDHAVLTDPRSVVFDRQGLLWVLDGQTASIHCFDSEGNLLSSLGSMVSGTDKPLRQPSDLCFTSDGRLVISDTGNNRMIVCRILYEAQQREPSSDQR